MQKIILLLLISSLVACENNTNTAVMDTDSLPIVTDTTIVNTTPAKQCYSYYQNKDTIVLQIDIAGTAFSGHLLYALHEKDRNDGNLQGVVKGDTLIADYTFSSEGTKSVRQVAFLKQQEGLKEGFGEVEEKEGKMIFKNLSALSFTGFILPPAACK